ncbi:polysaccharide pyruvyl transferase family protein [Shouchella tritolerans]|uniref:polysaccharide pyruvyl transferase family protein n=1 Tax=Shouchella tritolerans TaxID=2979466 RepID=UPI0021E8AE0B|nr:polysaccharide pyruvyl transferase family protein [Shouchella tritolerans]
MEDNFSSHEAGVHASRKKLLAAIGNTDDVTFIRADGNIGDHLIWGGTRKLLEKTGYKEIVRERLVNEPSYKGDTAIVTGGGGWCRAFHSWPEYLPLIESRFEKVVVFPTSFDTSLPIVKKALSHTKAKVFARERTSYKQIKDLCDGDIAYDCAFFYDFSSYIKKGKGALNAFRMDPEKEGHEPPPRYNNDISVTCQTLDAWLKMISDFDAVYTDRAHVMIGAAKLGKKVYYGTSNYHKVPAIAEFSLKDFPVYRI